jgi:peptide/nickel transport system permease protein
VSAPPSDIAIGPPAGPLAAVSGRRLLRRLRGDPLGLLGLALVAAVVFCGLFADWIAPYDPFKINVPAMFSPPSAAHIMGTDNLGRDIFSRVLKGSQIALLVGVSSILISQVIGLALGLVAGYGPRWLDNGLILVFDAIYSFPGVILGAVAMAIVGPSMYMLMLVVVIIQTPAYARLVRTATLAKKNSDFVLAERSLGAGPIRILVRHILPNIVGPLFIIGSMDIPTVVTLEAGLTYLGLGLPPPAPSWGGLIAEGRDLLAVAPWVAVAPGCALALTVLGANLMAEGARARFDPRAASSEARGTPPPTAPAAPLPDLRSAARS